MVDAVLVVDRPVIIVEREVPAGTYQVRLDATQPSLTITGPITRTFRAMKGVSEQPEPVPRAALQPYAPDTALLLFFEPPHWKWTATKREAPL